MFTKTAAALFFLASLANATTMTFATVSGSTLDSQPLYSQVKFETFDGGTLKVTLTNLIENPKSVIQNISGLQWKLDDGSAASASIVSSSGRERTVNSNKTFTDGSVVSTGWALDPVGGMGYQLRGLGSGTVGPKHTIIGLPNASSLYANANGSIKGNGPHNPFLAGDVVFTLSIPGVDHNTRVQLDSVKFAYGTEAGRTVGALCTGGCEPPVHTETPEPSTWAMMLSGAALIAARFYKRG